jgi:hypothetical protein
MAGSRTHPKNVHYVRNDVALGHGAGVEHATSEPSEAYAPYPKWQKGPPASWSGMPWA